MEKFKDVFKEELKARIENLLNVEVIYNEVEKTNGVKKTGMTFTEDNINPVIYIDEFFEKHISGKTTMENIEKEIIEIFNKSKKEAEQLMNKTEVYKSFELAKDNIIPCLVNSKMNEELLNKVLYVDYMDLSIIFRIIIDDDGEQIASTILTKDIFKNWNIPEHLVFEAAMENLKKTDFEFMTLAEKIGIPDTFMGEEKLYYLSNSTNVQGAAIILRDDVCDKIREEIGNAYIIPSSIHELLIVPMDFGRTTEINNMIEEVNDSTVEPKEVLGNHVYYLVDGIVRDNVEE